ncbi:zinc-dependent alcohol dehydrogenase family protein [Stenotrophomonas aracearum]|jgi:NADPH2:quinone reductase|uniref:Zinc-dependent alcohol dehydrogenase family protein n=1 Tax=Stenotrophomonas aracearum TaxID=3003272 RepID=A0ABY9YIG9_9GAMM|nr:zinc-dependent alcohol dehydrogenase family protein [Stenotrophomonas sp. A5588]WNH50431.1 zinc-dependent alcohol dehydrogenase family protein [Stenotrophomonas sp. A5588]
MKAVVLTSFGGPEAFELREVPVPVPPAGHVLVRVQATSINPLDYQVRRGDYADLVPLPAITGYDVSGVVEAVGPGVSSFSVGDEVWYTPQIFDGPGSYADYHVVAEAIIGLKPPSLTHLEAASVTLVGGTAWEALTVRAGLRVGESILVHGGAGGVGHVAIQLAKAIGARVYTTARKSQFEFVRSLGADVLIDFENEDYVEVIQRETGGHGVDVVFDTVGGDTLARSADVLAQLGRVVSIVDIAQPQNLIQAWGKNASYHFVFTRQNRGKLDELSALIERGQLRPHVGAVFQLAEIAAAHAFLQRPDNGLLGKVAIAVGPLAEVAGARPADTSERPA